MARRFSGTLGNCRVAVSVHTAADVVGTAGLTDVPEAWDGTVADDPEVSAAIAIRRRRSATPDDERHRTRGGWHWEWSMN